MQPLKLNEDWAQRRYLLAVRRQDVLPPSLRRFVDTLCPAIQGQPAASAKAPSARARA